MMDSTSAKTVHSQDGGPGRAGSQKIENHHMGDSRHVDMFSRTECNPEIDSVRLRNRIYTIRQLGKAV